MMTQSGEHRERTAVVIGGAGSIGPAIVDRLLSEGARVCVLDLEAKSWPGQSEVTPDAHAITLLQVDASNEADLESAVDTIATRAGRIDYLIFCPSMFSRRAFLDLDPQEWKKTLDVNLTGAFLCCRSATRRMRVQRFGRIVLFSSIFARTGTVNGAHYAAATGGILGLARTLALEVAHANIRVNTVSPGITDTAQSNGSISAVEIAQGAQIPLGRLGRADDMVEACLFLLSEESSYFTGQDIRVNGGARLW
jgi:NAD(P)-dependent dehydrogenase (short-subunit alcohol dehydrogenase family)